jgi:hypothetical protein
MSIWRRIVAIVIALVFVVLGVGIVVLRVGTNESLKASGGWWGVAIISLLVLLIAFLVYRTVSSRLNH